MPSKDIGLPVTTPQAQGSSKVSDDMMILILIFLGHEVF